MKPGSCAFVWASGPVSSPSKCCTQEAAEEDDRKHGDQYQDHDRGGPPVADGALREPAVVVRHQALEDHLPVGETQGVHHGRRCERCGRLPSRGADRIVLGEDQVETVNEEQHEDGEAPGLQERHGVHPAPNQSDLEQSDQRKDHRPSQRVDGDVEVHGKRVRGDRSLEQEVLDVVQRVDERGDRCTAASETEATAQDALRKSLSRGYPHRQHADQDRADEEVTDRDQQPRPPDQECLLGAEREEEHRRCVAEQHERDGWDRSARLRRHAIGGERFDLVVERRCRPLEALRQTHRDTPLLLPCLNTSRLAAPFFPERSGRIQVADHAPSRHCANRPNR